LSAAVQQLWLKVLVVNKIAPRSNVKFVMLPTTAGDWAKAEADLTKTGETCGFCPIRA